MRVFYKKLTGVEERERALVAEKGPTRQWKVPQSQPGGLASVWGEIPAQLG